MNAVKLQLEAARAARERLDVLEFAPPVACVYDPLDYAWGAYEEYVVRYGEAIGRVLFLGMNPGPWGMAQAGVPFGEVSAVVEWLKITSPIGRPVREHSRYPVRGYDCPRSEASGKRLWGFFRKRFGDVAHFFERHFVVNYCPLLFIASGMLKNGLEGARNLTPDKLPRSEREVVLEICDDLLRSVIHALEPRCVVGVGNFAAQSAARALEGCDIPMYKILHPSPASPKSNVDWEGEVTRQLVAQGVWA